MSVRTDVVNLQININGNAAQNNLNELRKKAASITSEMSGLKKGTQEYIDKAKALKSVTTEMDSLKKSIGITALSQKELTAELNKLKALRGSMVPFSAEFKALSKEIGAVETRLYNVRNGVQGFQSFLSKISDGVKQFGVVAAGYLGFQFLTSQFQNIISGAGKLSDQLADLRRVTDLTADEATKLNNALSNIDTRTSTSGLREIAIIAGKLGVEGVDNIASFTEATDKLVVSLGDELGNADQITTSLGKILNVFDGGVTGDNITKLGNAIVQLANDGVASGGFIVDFTTRLAGLSNVAGITLDASVGLAAGLEELGLRSESSTTAVIKILGDIASDVPKFAKVAGKSIEEFSTTLATKPIEALIQVSEGFSKNKSGFAEISASFKEAGADGARVVSTLGTIGGKADFLRGKITDAGVALQNTNAITDAFNLKNQTLGATLDKLAKEFNKLIMSSGVSNFFKGIVEGAVSFIDVLKKVPSFINDNSTALKILIAGIALLNFQYIKSAGIIALDTILRATNAVVTRATAVATALASSAQAAYITVTTALAGRITIATAAQRLWNIAMSLGAGPIGIIIVLAGAAVVAFKSLSTSMSSAAIAARTYAEVQKRAAESNADELQKIRELTNVIKDSSISRETQATALKELIALNPKYLSGLTAENIATAEGTKILNDYVIALRKKAEQEAATELQKEKIRDDVKLQLKQLELEKSIANGKETYTNPAMKLLGISGEKFTLNQIKKERAAIAEELKVTDELIKEKYKVIDKTISNGGDGGGGKPDATTANNSSRTIEVIKAQIKELDDAFEKIDVSNKKSLNSNRINREALQKELDALEGRKTGGTKKSNGIDQLKKEAEAFAAELKKLRRDAENNTLTDSEREIQIIQDKYNELVLRAKKYWAENTNLGKQKLAEILAIRDMQLQSLIKKQFDAGSEKEYADSLKNLDSYFEQERNKLGMQYADGTTNKRQYEAGLKDIEKSETDNRLIIAKDYSGNVKKAAEDVTTFTAAQQKQQTTTAIAEGEKRTQATLDEQMAAARLKVLTSRPGSNGRLEAQKELLKIQFENDTEYLDKKSAVYLEKEAELNNALAELDAQFTQQKIDNIVQYIDYALQALDGLNRIITNRENAAFNKEKKLLDKRKSVFKKQLDDKLISQAQYDKKMAILDEQREAAQLALSRKQAKREKALTILSAVLSTAQAVAGALAAKPIGPWNIAQAAIFGVLGAVQVGIAASAPIPEMGRGGFLKNGPKHSSNQKGLHVVNPLTGNTEMLVEQGEAVLNARAMSSNSSMTLSGTPRQIASSLNSAYGGVSFAGGASWMSADMPRIRPSMPRIMAGGGIISNSNDAASSIAADNMLIAQEIRGLRADVAGWNKDLTSHVVYKDVAAAGNLYDAAKKASSISQ